MPTENTTTDVKEKYRDDLETWEIGNEHACSIVLSVLPEIRLSRVP